MLGLVSCICQARKLRFVIEFVMDFDFRDLRTAPGCVFRFSFSPHTAISFHKENWLYCLIIDYSDLHVPTEREGEMKKIDGGAREAVIKGVLI